jgi:hypothetical protein
MPGRVRRRLALGASEAREWAMGRDDAVGRAISCGLGIRPPEWWRFESARPDLAEGADGDLYAHLPGSPGRERAVERLRHLVASGELSGPELVAVETGEGSASDWRRGVLGQTTAVQ